MDLYTLPITVQANTKQEAEQKIQELIEHAAVPEKSIVRDLVEGVLSAGLYYYATKQIEKQTRLQTEKLKEKKRILNKSNRRKTV